MATVYLRPGSRYWMARFKGPNGVWLARSTKESDRSKALRISFEWEGAGATMRTDNPTAAQVDRVVRDIWQRYTGKRIALNRTDEFLRGWAKNLKVKPGTLKRYNQVIEEFITLLGERAAFDLRAVETSHVQEFVNRDQVLLRSGRTIDLNAKILRAAFNTAVRAGFIEKNPAGLLQLPAVIEEDKQPFTAGEVETLLAYTKAANSDWQTCVMLGAYAGLRLGDAASVQWENIDLAGGVLRIIPQKTSRKGKRLTIPLHRRLRKHLDALASTDAAQGEKFLCPDLAGRGVGGRKGLSEEFKGIMAAANVEDGMDAAQDGRKRRFSKKSFHSLRHFHVSALANAGVSEDARARLVGHADPKETARYSHLEIKTLRKAVNLVGAKK